MPTKSTEHPMKWHKFVIYFQLWFAVFIEFCASIMFFTGAQYGSNTSVVYTAFPRLKVLDMLFGVASLALIIYVIYVRFQLAQFKTNAPMKLLVLYMIEFASPLIYPLGASAVTGMKYSTLTEGDPVWVQLVVFSIFIWLNKIYYDKRMDLFIN